MPLLECTNCQHEFEAKTIKCCERCGGRTVVVEERTAFENLVIKAEAEDINSGPSDIL